MRMLTLFRITKCNFAGCLSRETMDGSMRNTKLSFSWTTTFAVAPNW